MRSIYLIGLYTLMLNCASSLKHDHLKFEADDKRNDEIMSSEADKIINLPGTEHIPRSYDMYSGYLDASEDDHLFYWLVKSEAKKSNQLVIWFNGGPGCSSLGGLFTEHGPYKFDESGKLVSNPQSWNKIAHILYIESPVETGFSYTTNFSRPIDDSTTAVDNLLAIKNFYQKFPYFKNYELYIAGESYAGVYIPTLVQKIIFDENSDIRLRLKGILIGNGLLSKKLNLESLIKYAYYHGLISPTMHEQIMRLCHNGKDYDYGDRSSSANECFTMIETMRGGILSGILNSYNYAQDCFPIEFPDFYGTSTSSFVETEYQCSNVSLLTSYLNRKDVQKSLHARLEGNSTTWKLCSDILHIQYVQFFDDMSQAVKDIVLEMPFMRIVFFAGDLDLVCNFLGNEMFVDNLGYDVTTSRRKWTVKSKNGEEQLAGYYKEYDNILFATFKAAGHMVPTDKPVQAFYMLKRVLADEPL